MRTDKFIFGFHDINSLVPPVIGLTDRFIKTSQLEQLVQIVIHLLITDNRQSFVVRRFKGLVFFKNLYADIIEFYFKTIERLHGRDLDMVTLDIVLFQVGDIRITKACIAAE